MFVTEDNLQIFSEAQPSTVMALSLCVQDCTCFIRYDVTFFDNYAYALLPFYPNTDLHNSLHQVREADKVYERTYLPVPTLVTHR